MSGTQIPDDWEPNQSDMQYGHNLGLSPAAIAGMAEDMRLWARANRNRQVARKADWNLTFKGWMRRGKERQDARQPKPRTLPPTHYPKLPKEPELDRSNRPTYAELCAKYGGDGHGGWGLSTATDTRQAFPSLATLKDIAGADWDKLPNVPTPKILPEQPWFGVKRD